MTTHIAFWMRRACAVGALSLVAIVGGCGGGGSAAVVVANPPPITALGIVLTRTGPESVQVDWSDDPAVDNYTIDRNGNVLTDVRSTTLIDSAVVLDETYCYQVFGYDSVGNLVAQSDQACITLVP